VQFHKSAQSKKQNDDTGKYRRRAEPQLRENDTMTLFRGPEAESSKSDRVRGSVERTTDQILAQIAQDRSNNSQGLRGYQTRDTASGSLPQLDLVDPKPTSAVQGTQIKPELPRIQPSAAIEPLDVPVNGPAVFR
jgi:hypothetical protein